MTNPPKITPVGRRHDAFDDKARWVVSIIKVQHYGDVTDWLPLPEALKALRYELNMHVVELHRLAGEAGVPA